jgi:hypothetical protein
MADTMPDRTLAIIIGLAFMSLLIPSSPNLGELGQVISFQKTNIVDAFAVGEALIRCTDGKLVNSQDQCPGSDICPPPQNNTISNCLPRESSNATTTVPGKENATNVETANNTNHCLKDRFTIHTPQCTK